MRELIEQEIQFLREQIKTLRRTAAAIERQIDHCETRVDDLRKAVSSEVIDENRA